MFVDSVTLQLSAGKGGDGVISWRREKFIPKGGPAGGDGGNGGSVILEADPQIHSLEDYRNKRILKAESGRPGGSNNCTGKNGSDLILKVPCGTLVKDSVTKEVLYDLTEKGQQWKICQGGKGGKGNSRFKTPTNQAPFVYTKGTAGQECEVELELKLIADIGFVGMPNAGKSTLISELAHIRVKIAPYPFTTLRPNLGILQFDDYSRLLLADIPGIIEDAHEDKGLGLSFLKHIERTSALIYVIELAPYQDRDPFEEFLMLRRELEAYNSEMLSKPFLVAINKIDQEEVASLAASFRERYPFDASTLFEISALNGIGTDALKEAIRNLVPRQLLAESYV
ncbi:MAG: GTPase ObgE [Verrucomicrobia bacterium]|nr:GTPase ObgE [Verrucomicrobiota bacterium]